MNEIIETDLHLNAVLKKKFLKSCNDKGEFSFVDVLLNTQIVVPKNSIVGLIGLNGAGKTTALSILSGLKSITGGEIRYVNKDKEILSLSCDFDETKVLRNNSNILLGGDTIPFSMNFIEYINFFLAFHDKPILSENKEIDNLFIELCKRFRITNEFFNVPLETLSKGMKQKVSIIATLLLSKDCPTLDEFTVGIDSISVENSINFLLEYRKNNPNKSFLITTHIIDEIIRLSDYAIVLQNKVSLFCIDLLNIKRNFELIKVSFDLKYFFIDLINKLNITSEILEDILFKLEKRIVYVFTNISDFNINIKVEFKYLLKEHEISQIDMIILCRKSEIDSIINYFEKGPAIDKFISEILIEFLNDYLKLNVSIRDEKPFYDKNSDLQYNNNFSTDIYFNDELDNFINISINVKIVQLDYLKYMGLFLSDFLNGNFHSFLLENNLFKYKNYIDMWSKDSRNENFSDKVSYDMDSQIKDSSKKINKEDLQILT